MTRPTQSFVAVLAGLIALSIACADASRAGELDIYESSAGPGLVRSIAGPVTNALIDIDYAPITAEGGKLYGMSELEIQATGNLVLSPTGFTCQATSCLYSPLPFVSGQSIRVTAGNDLAGEIASAANLLRIGVTGSTGHIVLARGEYLDGTGNAATVGAVRNVDVTLLVTVPEIELAAGLAATCGLLAGLGGRRRAACATRARASVRSERGPGARAPRGR